MSDLAATCSLCRLLGQTFLWAQYKTEAASASFLTNRSARGKIRFLQSGAHLRYSSTSGRGTLTAGERKEKTAVVLSEVQTRVRHVLFTNPSPPKLWPTDPADRQRVAALPDPIVQFATLSPGA